MEFFRQLVNRFLNLHKNSTGMKYFYRSLLSLAVLLNAAVLCAQSSDFRTGKGMDTYYKVLRELNALYVDTVDNEKLINASMRYMLSTLDPYTEFIDEESSENIDMLITGAYGGIGSIIKKVDSLGVVITAPYENSAAVKYGLEPGDAIIEINGESVKNLKASECTERMKGVPGTEVVFKVVKRRTGDTVDVAVVRERIRIPDVTYSGIIRDSIGYIKISAFTQGGAADVRKAFEALEKSGRMKRLVLDLRGNGGGSMDEAVGIVSLFVPYGTKVVEQRGRISVNNRIYTTSEAPVDTLIPVMVMVNSGSASASEIVAGSLQDLDRAVVAGTRSFGKGLVQTIRDVGYGNTIKLTTAKYYIPSGRCVQAIDYSNRNEDGSVGTIPDSLKHAFTTKNGRTVYDGGGIDPDLKVDAYYYSRVAASLIFNDIIGDYAISYYAAHDSIAPASVFSLSDSEYAEFVDYAESREFDCRTAAAFEIDELKKALEEENLESRFAEQIEWLEKTFNLGKREVLELKKEEIKGILEDEIVSKYYFTSGEVESFLKRDKQLSEALDKVDFSILSPAE